MAISVPCFFVSHLIRCFAIRNFGIGDRMTAKVVLLSGLYSIDLACSVPGVIDASDSLQTRTVRVDTPNHRGQGYTRSDKRINHEDMKQRAMP